MGTNIELSERDKRDIQASKRNRIRSSEVGVGTPTASVLRRRASNLCQYCANNSKDCMTCGWDKTYNVQNATEALYDSEAARLRALGWSEERIAASRKAVEANVERYKAGYCQGCGEKLPRFTYHDLCRECM